MNAHVETSVHESSATESSTRLTLAIQRARHALLASQHQDGYWCFELEADCTIPSEYVLLMHYMNTVRVDVQAKIAVYLRERELETGGWPLYAGGQFDMSCSVKTYYALKLAGRWDGNIRKRDLEIDSPYNTYRHAGLPPGPLGSPGKDSIRAVLDPTPGKELYFVSRNDGTHEFSETLGDHNRAVNRYQKRRTSS